MTDIIKETVIKHRIRDPKLAQVLEGFKGKTDQIIDAINGALADVDTIQGDLPNYLLVNGSRPLTASWDAGAFTITAKKMKCTESINVLEQASAPSATADTGKIYALSADSQLYFRDDGGTIYQLTGGWGTMYVATNQTNSTTTPANVTGFSFPVEANKVYGFRFWMKAGSGAATCGIHLSFTGPASPTEFYWSHGRFNLRTLVDWVEDQYSGFGTAATDDHWRNNIIQVVGFLRNGANAGTVQMQFDSEVASTTVTIYAGSWGTWHKLN